MRTGLAIIIIFGLSSTLTAYEQRIWTDSTGKHQVEATLVSVDGENIKIQKTDGKFLTMPLSKLSEEDRKYVEAETSDNPFAGGSDDPNTPIPPTKNEKSSTGTLPKPQLVDLERAATGGGVTDTRWSINPDPDPGQSKSEKTRNVLFSVEKLSFGTHCDMSDYFFQSTGSPAVLIAGNVENVHDEQTEPYTKVFLGNLTTGQSNSYQTPYKIVPLGISPDGTKVLFRKEEWGFGNSWGTRGVVIVAKNHANHLEPLSVYEPFGRHEEEPDPRPNFPSRRLRPSRASEFSTRHIGPDFDIEWGDWVDNDHVLLLSHKGILLLLNTTNGTAVWKKDGGNAAKAVLSPGRRYCLLTGTSGTLFLHAMTGEPIGLLEDAPFSHGFNMFAFSPDGRMIASRGKGEIHLWDATTGEKQAPIWIDETLRTTSLIWLDHQYLLAGPILIDTIRKVPVWKYESPGPMKYFAGKTWYLSSRMSDDSTLVGVALPHSKVAKLPEKINVDDVFYLHPGMAVSIQIAPHLKENRDEITKLFEHKLDEIGMKVNANGEIKLSIGVDKEKPIKVSYGLNESGAPKLTSGGTPINFQPYKFTIKMEKENEVIWSTQQITQPPELITAEELKKYSVQEAVNRSMMNLREEFKNWYLPVSIPRLIQNPQWGGTSRLMESGIVEVPPVKPLKK